MPLSDVRIRSAKPGASERKLFDEKGLFLLILPSGTKNWKLKYQYAGREKKLSLGSYPEIGLKDARRRAEDARRQLTEGIDPSATKRLEAIAREISAHNSFAAVAGEFIDKMEREGKGEATLSKARWFLSLVEPSIGNRPVREIRPAELLLVLKRLEKKGNLETARRLRSFVSRVFRYAVATARAEQDPAEVLRGALITPTVRHHSTITDPVRVGHLMRDIEGYSGEPTIMLALRLTPHLFQRPGELRHMEWSEIDLHRAVWCIPALKMKMRREHRVPLSRQALEILTSAKALTGTWRYVFPCMRSTKRPMSENTINAALRRLGYSGSDIVAHGFRRMGSTFLNEARDAEGRRMWDRDAIERHLAHQDKDSIRSIYNDADYWEERVRMIQWWSDHLDMLKLLKPEALAA
jgi:integrase